MVIGDKVTNIDAGAFTSLEKLVYNVYENCKYLGSKDNPYTALIEGGNYNNITIHPDTKVIQGGAFSGCDKITSIEIPDGVTTICNMTFSGCTSLTSIIIPDNITTIDDYAFQYCLNLTSVVIGDSVTTIGNYAFSECSNLTSVVIPVSVTKLGDNVFYNCSKLKDIYFTGEMNEWTRIYYNSNNSNLQRVTVHYNYVPEG